MMMMMSEPWKTCGWATNDRFVAWLAVTNDHDVYMYTHQIQRKRGYNISTFCLFIFSGFLTRGLTHTSHVCVCVCEKKGTCTRLVIFCVSCCVYISRWLGWPMGTSLSDYFPSSTFIDKKKHVFPHLTRTFPAIYFVVVPKYLFACFCPIEKRWCIVSRSNDDRSV